MEDDAEVRHSTILAYDGRGETLCVTEGDAAIQWALALENLPSFELKVALNAPQC